MHLTDRDQSIYIAGHRGLVGSAVVRCLRAAGYEHLLLRSRPELDLCDQAAVDAFFEAHRPAFVVVAAAKVGGILANATYPSDFLVDNLAIELNVIRAAHRTGVQRLVFLGSSCIYPKHAPQPMREEHLLTGPLEPTNEWYAVAKIAGVKLCQAFRKQHGDDFLSLMPTNLYGPGDTFDLQTSHVLPALIRKFHEARRDAPLDDAPVTLWGTGTPKREFLYSDDLADAVLFVLQQPAARLYDVAPDGMLNVGVGEDIAIRDLAGLIREVVGARSPIELDRSKPDGTPRKLMDVTRMTKLGWTAGTPLREGIRQTYDWYRKHEYEVHGIKRRASQFNTQRIDHLYEDPHEEDVRLHLHYGDMTDSTNLIRIVQEVQPDEIYNLAAQSHVQVSFETPEYTANADALGTLRLLEAMRILKLEGKTRFYQASTSELYGKVCETPQRETTPFYPRSPYGVAKLYAYWITVNYREAYGMFASNGILFNHESPTRGETFVTRKITRAVARIKLGLQDRLYIGNLDARRDWGHAKDYVEAMWQILQQDVAQDYVIATGRTTTVRSFCEQAFRAAEMEVAWEGAGAEEKGYRKDTGQCVVEIDPRYFRPTEVDLLLGDAVKARRELGWAPRYTLEEMIEEMMAADLEEARDELTLANGRLGTQARKRDRMSDVSAPMLNDVTT